MEFEDAGAKNMDYTVHMRDFQGGAKAIASTRTEQEEMING